MSIQNQGNLPRLLQEGVNAVAQAQYDRYQPEWKPFLAEKDSRKAYEIDVSKATYGAAQLKPEGSETATDVSQQIYSTVYQNAIYALGTEITHESIINNLYEDEMEEAGIYLEESLEEAENIVAADVINSGYTTFQTGDGVSVFSTAHLLKNGTFANRFSSFRSLSEAALEDACIAISKFVGPSGKRIMAKPQGLCIPTDLQFTACRLIKSTLQAETGNNAVNAINAKGMFPDGYSENHYFTDPGQWFITTNVRNGGKFFRREDHTFKSDNSNTGTLNYRHMGYTNFAVGVTDPRAYFGSGPSV